MNWRYNSSLGDWLLLQCAALLISFLIFVPHFHAQTQAAMNAQARADFARAFAAPAAGSLRTEKSRTPFVHTAEWCNLD